MIIYFTRKSIEQKRRYLQFQIHENEFKFSVLFQPDIPRLTLKRDGGTALQRVTAFEATPSSVQTTH